MATEFTAEVTEVQALADGKHFGLVLPATLFYPTSGGQGNDTGIIGSARVVDVFIKGEEIVHVLDRALEPGSYPAKIDWERRFGHMQHHSGQHIFSAVFWQELGLETLSSHISIKAPSTIDFNINALSDEELIRVEKVANQIIFANYAMKSYVVENNDSVPFRRPPKVSGNIRVVEIDGYDYSACGGTHTPQTGMVGMLKIIRTERINQKTRVHFVAGWETLAFLRKVQSEASETSALLDTGSEDMAEAVKRLKAQLKETERELKSLRQMKLEIEAEKMAQFAESIGEKWLATSLFENRDAGEMRILAMKLRVYPGMVAVLASFDGEKLSLVTACADDIELDANVLLQDHLAPINGRGGGDKSIAQGGGTANNVDELFKHTAEMVRNS